jgi:hypothetical protein
LEQEQERDIELIEQDNISNPKVRDKEEIDLSFKERRSNFGHFAKSESILAQDGLAVLPIDRNFANEPKMRSYGEIFPNNLHVRKISGKWRQGVCALFRHFAMNSSISHCTSGNMANASLAEWQNLKRRQ